MSHIDNYFFVDSWLFVARLGQADGVCFVDNKFIVIPNCIDDFWLNNIYV